jgi:hypothetical protein
VYDDPEQHRHKSALIWLNLMTGKSFDSPEDWEQWWQANRANLVLSADGLELGSRKN